LSSNLRSTAKKILYIHHVSGGGGALESLLRVIIELDKTKYYAKVLCPDIGASYEMFKNNNIDADIERGIKSFNHSTGGWYSLKNGFRIIIGFFNMFNSAFILYKVFKREKPDIVHLSSSNLIGPAIATKLAGIPLVWHVREYIHNGYLGIRKKIISELIDRLSDIVISITYSDASRLKLSKKLCVIYDSLDFNRFNRNLDGHKFKAEFNIKNQNKVVGMFGGISRIKGTLEFIKAAKQILKSETNVKFFIVGTNNYSDNGIKTRIKKILKKILFREEAYDERVTKEMSEDTKEKIFFIGYRKDVPQIMAGLDLIVFPATVPHSAMPIMEAGAMAKPVIASKCPHMIEEVIDGITGVLVEPGNIEDLANAIISLLSDLKLTKYMGEEGYIQSRKLFDITDTTNKVQEVYDEILSG